MKGYVIISSSKTNGYVFDELEFICTDYKRAKEICNSMSKDKRMYYKVRIEEHEIMESEAHDESIMDKVNSIKSDASNFNYMPYKPRVLHSIDEIMKVRLLF